MKLVGMMDDMKQDFDLTDTHIMYVCSNCKREAAVPIIRTVPPDLSCQCTMNSNEVIHEMIPKISVKKPKHARKRYQLRRKFRRGNKI